jgi:1-acyl-sn-glycerol-3-phosphate acyltransferase
MPSPHPPRRSLGLRGALGFAAAGLVTVVLTVGLLAVPSRVALHSPRVERALRAGSRWWLRAMRARLDVHGLEHIRPGQAYVIVANHQSALDPMAVLAALPHPVRFLAKAELFRLPAFGPALRRVGMVAVDRGAVDARGVIDGADRVLAAGRSLLVFPEGTVSADGRLLPFKPGAFAIAHAHRVPVLPVTISGTRTAWPVRTGRLVPHPVTVRVEVGEELAPAGRTRRDIVAVRARARDVINDSLARHAAQEAALTRPGGDDQCADDECADAGSTDRQPVKGQPAGSGSLRVGSTVSMTSPVAEGSTR